MATAPSDVAVRQWMADFVAETLRGETLEQMVARLDAQIIGRVQELTDRDLRRDLESSTRAHALAVLSGLTQDAMEYAVPEQAHAFARTLARRGYDLRLLLRVYHAGQEAAIDYMTEVIDERRLPEQFERSALIRLFERSTRWVNTSVEALTDTYMQERERGLRAALNQRTEIVRTLLSEEEVDADYASARLGFRLAQRQVAIVLWTDSAARGAGALLSAAADRFAGAGRQFELPGTDDGRREGDPVTGPLGDGIAGTDGVAADLGADDRLAAGSDELGRLERTATRLATALGGVGVLTVPAGSAALWAWLAADAEAVAAVAADIVAAPMRLALGSSATGVAGFRQSHRDAIAARQVAERAAVDLGRVLPYARVEPAYLAGADVAAMRALIRRELGPLAAPDANSARLRETLLAYLRCHRSPEGAAARLGVHKNTVRYRIQRIEETLGRRIEECGLRLELALECVAVYGV
ncbi:helix-turn-helix domain-containing protein [Nocardia sp. BSTN01]|uniref:PucR family transcriptional regulator n=1 Tax=Nocardia sp. BSTN01 TaxID=2783665 RepID=UPI00188DD11C|nr:helix-turn-helix domain-containing protein [Nocardia sp. BSTN01]MBF5001480.1 helix-turn-helix domain-containing protein [Nocardia sp. BSTN01]